jgi:multidrug efflux pump subunit AcrA (membrane-fusion protein)
MHPNPRRIAPIILLVLVTGGAIWYFTWGRSKEANGALVASGTIEGTQVILAPELAGRVLEVLVQKGEQVEAGQVLVRFDDTLMQAQLSQAQAALHQAQANYDLVSRGPTPEQRQLAIASAQTELTNAQQALQALNDNARLSEAQSMQSVASIDKARISMQLGLR